MSNQNLSNKVLSKFESLLKPKQLNKMNQNSIKKNGPSTTSQGYHENLEFSFGDGKQLNTSTVDYYDENLPHGILIDHSFDHSDALTNFIQKIVAIIHKRLVRNNFTKILNFAQIKKYNQQKLSDSLKKSASTNSDQSISNNFEHQTPYVSKFEQNFAYQIKPCERIQIDLSYRQQKSRVTSIKDKSLNNSPLKSVQKNQLTENIGFRVKHRELSEKKYDHETIKNLRETFMSKKCKHFLQKIDKHNLNSESYKTNPQLN